MTPRPSLAGLGVLIVFGSAAGAVAQTQFEELIGARPAIPSVSLGIARAAVAHDIDGDGDADLVIASMWALGGMPNRLYLNNGRGSFRDRSSRLPTHVDASNAVAVGDIDNDGDPDLVFGNLPIHHTTVSKNRLYVNDGTGRFTDATSQLPGGNDYTEDLVFADVDGDRDFDLFVANRSANLLYVNDGRGVFTDVSAAQLPANLAGTLSAAAGDVDADGDVDLVLGNEQQNELWLNDGRGFFTDATASQLPPDSLRATDLALGDVDADGDLDIVIGNTAFIPFPGPPQQNSLYLNDGSGNFVDATANRMPVDGDVTEAVALGDTDDDGDLDIVFGNSVAFPGGFSNRLYLNDGSGSFVDATTRLPQPVVQTYSLSLFDIDSDGDADLFEGNSNSDRLVTNLHRQLSALAAPRIGQPWAIDYHAQPGYASGPNTALGAVSLGAFRLPLVIPGLGAWFLDPTRLAVLRPVAIPSATGKATQLLGIPPDPGLLGVAVFLQALIVEGVPPTRVRLTGYVADLIVQ